MKLIFWSMHGSAAQEIALLCIKSGINISFPLINNSGPIRTLTNKHDGFCLKIIGAEIIPSEFELEERIKSKDFDAAILSSPDQIKSWNENYSSLKIPLIVRHGLNSFDKFKTLKVKNFISCSQKAIEIMNDCESFLSKKLISWGEWPRSKWAEERQGFASYIHHYGKKFPEEFKQFNNLCESLKKNNIILKNFGKESIHGETNDLEMMTNTIATIHIKGGNAVCNSVIRSMSLGTPVIMNKDTYIKCFFDQIKGIIITDNIEKEIIKMDKDVGYVEEKSDDTLIEAKKQFSYTEELGEKFIKFLSRLRT